MPSQPLTSHCSSSSSSQLHGNTKEIADRYKPEKSLRSALFGEILLCRDRLTLERVIVKTVDLQLARRQTSRTQELVQENVQLEVEGLNRVRALGGHPNVIKLHRCFVAKGVLHLVLDYCEGGDLLDACVQQRRSPADDHKKTKSRSSCKSSNDKSSNSNNGNSKSSNSSTGCGCSDGSCSPREDAIVVTRATLGTDTELSPEDDDEKVNEDNGPLLTGVNGSKRLQETVAHKYLVDVLSGLRFLHAHGIAHRDVSLENILLRNGCAVLADFGLCVPELSSLSTSSLSRASWSHMTTAADAFYCNETVGKDYYMAPEIVARERYDPRKADIWATGIAFFILLTSSPPFERADPLDPGFRYVAKCGIQAVFTAWGLDQDVSEVMQDLLARMLCVDPEERITMVEIWQHPVLRRPRSSMLSTSGCN